MQVQMEATHLGKKRVGIFPHKSRTDIILQQRSFKRLLVLGQPLVLGRLLVLGQSLGKEHPSTLTSMNNLALVLDDLGKYERHLGS